MNLFPTLETERLILRRFGLSDVDALVDLLQEPDVALNVLNVPYPYTREIAEEYIRQTHENALKENGDLAFAMVNRGNQQVMGAVGIFFNPKHRRAGLGYWIGKQFWGQGYMTEAVARVIKFGFEERNMHRIFAECYPHNVASARVMEKNGMKRDGTLREHFYHELRQQYMDAHHYSILRQEYLQR